MVSSVPQVREKQMVRICLYVHVCVAPPMIVGAWSMYGSFMSIIIRVAINIHTVKTSETSIKTFSLKC